MLTFSGAFISCNVLFLYEKKSWAFVSLLKLVDTFGRENYLSSILFTFSFFWRPKNYWKKVFPFFLSFQTRTFTMKSDLTLIKFDNHMCVERNWWVIWKIRLPKIVILCQVKKNSIFCSVYMKSSRKFQDEVGCYVEIWIFCVKKFSSCLSFSRECDVTGFFL